MKANGRAGLYTIILTGLSGSGKSIALNALEDSGYFCVDNLPASLIKTFVHLCNKTPGMPRVAVGIDIRERKFFVDIAKIITSLKKSHDIGILFLEAGDTVLIRRFKETRRPHPLGNRDLKKSIRDERNMLSELKNIADNVIDTSALNPHQLRKMVIQQYSRDSKKRIDVSLVSFGYKYGTPAEADLLFDVRFLPNPHFVDHLKPLTGKAEKVKRFVIGNKETDAFLARLYDLLEFLLPRYIEEGRQYLTIGVGCTGGRHRSPAVVEELKKSLKKKKFNVSVTHRDIHDLHG